MANMAAGGGGGTDIAAGDRKAMAGAGRGAQPEVGKKQGE